MAGARWAGLGVALALSACKCHEPARPPALERSQVDEDVKSVYPLTPPPPNAHVQSLCEAFQALPVRAAASCCHHPPGIVLTSECVRVLGSAVASQAVHLDDGEVARCVAAVERAHQGCEWVGPGSDPAPAECVGILHGTLAAGAICRSTFECEKPLHCRGVGPTQAGTCGPPQPDQTPCGRAVDPLVGYARQEGAAEEHPECNGRCERHFCLPAQANGEPCQFDGQCARGSHCAKDHCVAGDVSALGEACAGGGCGPLARCRNGTCVQPAPSGTACTVDADCRGGCLGPDGGAATDGGVCGPRC